MECSTSRTSFIATVHLRRTTSKSVAYSPFVRHKIRACELTRAGTFDLDFVCSNAMDEKVVPRRSGLEYAEHKQSSVSIRICFFHLFSFRRALGFLSVFSRFSLGFLVDDCVFGAQTLWVVAVRGFPAIRLLLGVTCQNQ